MGGGCKLRGRMMRRWRINSECFWLLASVFAFPDAVDFMEDEN